MKDAIHPVYRDVLFQDTSAGLAFLCRSTVETKDVAVYEVDGKEYPTLKLEISSASHPFFTGTQKLIDSAGRVERFNKRYAKSTPKKK